MVKLTCEVLRFFDGGSEQLKESHKLAEGHSLAVIDATLAAWFAKKIEPVEIFPGGHADVKNRSTIALTTKRCEDGRRGLGDGEDRRVHGSFASSLSSSVTIADAVAVKAPLAAEFMAGRMNGWARAWLVPNSSRRQ